MCIAAALFHHFKEPIMLVEGKQQWLFDETGRRYLDVSGCLCLRHACVRCVCRPATCSHVQHCLGSGFVAV